MAFARSLRDTTWRAGYPNRFISDDRVCVVLDDLRTRSGIDHLERVRSRAVLIKTVRQLPTVLAALEFDGIAHRIVLCPPDQWRHVPGIIKAAGIDAIASDDLRERADIHISCTLDHPVNTHRDIETEWILLTSGTTGQPKMVIHTLASLAGPLDDGLIAAGAVWSTFYDIRRYGGLQMLLRALLGGGSMILSDAEETVTAFLSRLGKDGVTHISGTPSHWRRALMTLAIDAISPRYVRLSGEIADQAILDRLGRQFLGASIAHAYATTEAGVGFDVRDGKAGFPADLIGNRSLKAELMVRNGTLHIRSPRTAKGYIGASLAGCDGFVDTGDLVTRHGERYYFVGRREGVINVAGQKVFPEEVEAVLTQHPDVQMARVWARKSPITGYLVAADLLLRSNRTDRPTFHSEMLDLCRHRLEAWKIPVSFREVDAIDLTPAGKIARHA
jgi:acyl-CoA synthetase (AMP-forming)/AMP-acid ligase II